MFKCSLHVPRFLRFKRSRSQEPLQAECNNATGVTSVPSSEVGTSRQTMTLSPTAPWLDPLNRLAHGGLDAAQSISGRSASQLTHPVPSPSPMRPASSYRTADFNQFQNQEQLAVPQWSPATGPQPLSPSQQLAPPLQQPLPHPQDGNPGPLNAVPNVQESRNAVVSGYGNYVNYSNTVVNSSNKFMAELLDKTIPGAAFDSSARDPPPRCHPGTRLDILARCLEFIANANGEKKMRWVVGAAGVGKSAIMQNVAESPLPSVSKRISIFFSINGRNDGTKAIITLAYQLAAKCERYRVLIEYEITRDPSLLQTSLSVQFNKFVIEPFILHPDLRSLDRVLIIIDGLDECDDSYIQRELLRLISDFCSVYPSSPIVWMISSRPEPDITSFLGQEHVEAVYEKEEVLVDSDEARSDVERFLRAELTRIKSYFSLNRPQWPPEQELWKLANASGGLFVYADTVIKYVGDRELANPTLQLSEVLKAIDAHPLPNVSQEKHPMARLDVLYTQILSKVPEKVRVDTQKILSALVLDSRREESLRIKSFLVLCNWLGLTNDEAYAAIRHLCSVLNPPLREKAHEAMLRPFHKSFLDYASDSTRSGPSSYNESETHQLEAECTVRILKQVPDGLDFGDTVCIIRGSNSSTIGALARGGSTGENISLSWPVGDEIHWNDASTRLDLYKLAISNVVEGIRKGEPAFCTEFCIRSAITQWHFYDQNGFPFQELQSLAFERSRRREFIDHGILRQVPVKVLNVSHIVQKVRLQFCRPIAPATKLSDPWNTSCKHERTGHWGKSKNEDWTTEFGSLTTSSICDFCFERMERQVENQKTRSPEHLITILLTSTGTCFAELQFIDADDGVSEWTYRLVCDIWVENCRF